MSTCSDTTGHQNSRARERPEPNRQALTVGETSAAVAGSTNAADALSLACRSPVSIRASARRVGRGLGCASQPRQRLGKLCGLDVSILAAPHGQPVSALAVMLPRRDQTGLMCSNQCFAIRCGRIDGAPELVELRVRSVLFRRSPSRGGLGRVRPGSSTGRFDRVRVEVRAVDHIVLVYYCGHTGQRSLLGGPPSRVSPCVLPGSVQAPWARREHPAPQSAGPSGDGAGGVAILGAAVLIVARRTA
jgi:hypothetical protein